MKKLNINVGEDQIGSWKEAAHDSRLSLSEWVRQTLDAKVKQQTEARAMFDGLYEESK